MLCYNIASVSGVIYHTLGGSVDEDLWTISSDGVPRTMYGEAMTMNWICSCALTVVQKDVVPC